MDSLNHECGGGRGRRREPGTGRLGLGLIVLMVAALAACGAPVGVAPSTAARAVAAPPSGAGGHNNREVRPHAVAAPPSGAGGHNNREVRPSPKLVDTATWTPFTSERYGYRLAFPPTFYTRPATKFWVIPETDTTSAAERDRFLLEAGDPTWTGASLALPKGESEGEWLAAYRQSQVDPDKPVCESTPASISSITIDGRPASLRFGCGEVEALVVADGRVYSFAGRTTATTTPGVPEDFRTMFNAWLTTIALDPGSARVASR